MPRRVSVFLPALLATVAAIGVGLPSAAQAATGHQQKFTKVPILIKVMVGPKDDIPCTVKADSYTPVGVTAARPAPAILTSNGFGGKKDDEGQKAGASAFAKAGYVVISYSGLGFGGSNCKIYLDDRDYDGKAGKQIVDVLAGSKSYILDDGSGRQQKINYVAKEKPGDPRVGMIGGSYGGQNQFAIAGQDPRIDAIIPEITWNDLSYSLSPNNTDQVKGVTYDTPGVAKKEWVDLFFGLGIVSGLQNTTTTDPTPLTGCPNFDNRACEAALRLNSLGYLDSESEKLARHASVSSFIANIKVPTLLVQGQNDTLFNIQEAVATYRALKAQGTTVAMSWFSGGHSGEAVAGDLDLTGGVDASHQGRRWIRWMDRYVRGNTSVGTGPQFEYFRDWVHYNGTAIDPAYASASSFSGAPTSTLFLSGEDQLTAARTSVQSGSKDFMASTQPGSSYSETSGVGNSGPTPQPPPSDGPNTFASYTTPELIQNTVLVGSAKLRMRLSAPVASAGAQSSGPAGKLVLFAKLYDVAPNNTVELQHRLISPVRIKDVDQPVTIELPGVAQRFAAGHRIRLVVAGGDLAYANNTTAQPVTIQTDQADPGTLTLPLVGDASGSCPTGTTGTPPFCKAPVKAAASPAGSGTGTTGGGGGDTSATSGSAHGGSQGGPASAQGAGTNASASAAQVSAATLPNTGAPRGLLLAFALGLALLASGLVLMIRGRVQQSV